MSDDFLPFCNEVVAKARAAGLRAEVDPGGRSLGKQINIEPQPLTLTLNPNPNPNPNQASRSRSNPNP